MEIVAIEATPRCPRDIGGLPIGKGVWVRGPRVLERKGKLFLREDYENVSFDRRTSMFAVKTRFGVEVYCFGDFPKVIANSAAPWLFRNIPYLVLYRQHRIDKVHKGTPDMLEQLQQQLLVCQ